MNKPNARFQVPGQMARFAVDDQNDVMLTLRDGQSLSWGYGHATDEGWTSIGYLWTLRGGELACEIVSDGSDCDGRLTTCTLLSARLEEIPASRWPNWHVVDERQRDQFAEAMGY